MHNVWQQLSKDISDGITQIGRAIVAVDGRSGHTSSGIVWRSGFVLTAAHTIKIDSQLAVIGNTRRPVRARLAGRDNGTDIALIQLDDGLESDVAEFAADGGSLAVGELVIAIGRTRRGNIVASGGILSGLMGEWQVGRTRIDQFIRPDLTLYPGFSGGALVNSEGKIIGMNSGGFLRGKPITLPHSTLARVAEELASKGRVARPYVGVVMQPVALPDTLQQLSGVGISGGLMVMHVEPQGPAGSAGALLGDILVELDGQGLDDLDRLQEILQRRGIGQEVKATIIRGGQKTDLNIKIGERPVR